MDKETKSFARKILIASVIVGAMYLLVSNISVFFKFISSFADALSPLVVGLVIAFILNVPMSQLEKLLLRRKPDMKPKTARRLAALATYVGALLLIILLISIIIPQVWSSALALATNLPTYVTTVVNFLNNLLKQIHVNYRISLDGLFTVPIEELGTNLAEWIESLTPTISSWIETLDPRVVSDVGEAALAVIGIIIKFFLGLIFSVYVLLSKEKFKSQVKMILNAFLKEETVSSIRYLVKKTEQIFSDFISGQLLEMAILGSIFFVVLTIARMPYALLISVVIAITSIIPYFGSSMAMIFGAILILAVSGMVRMIVFIAMFLVIQQIEDNLIYPHVVGNSVGLPAIWVLIAVTVFGSVFGVVGLITAVPLMALLYTLFSDYIAKRLERKEAVRKRLAK